METASRYWQLIRLHSSGRCQTQTMGEVQSWILRTYKDLPSDQQAANRHLQSTLFDLYRGQQAQAKLAQLSLRCYISHQIRYVCVQLANQFGETYGFNAADLFPLVLDDDGQLSSSYRSLGVDILETYDPTKAQLGTWVTQRVKSHPDLDRALLERGLYRASDWAILNDTTVEQLQRILRQYHLCSETEVTLASQLLSQYHRVYRQDRLSQRKTSRGRRCATPTLEQLARIDNQRSPNSVLAHLKLVAAQLRQYRTHVRGGNPIPYRGDEVNWERVSPDLQEGHLEDTEDGQNAFLEAYRQAVSQCLDNVLAQTIRAQIAKLAKRQPAKARAYVQGLHLFHCQGLSMGKLAVQVGLTSQVQVNRLLQLKRLRAEVRHQLIPQLQARVQAKALDFVSADQLQEIDRTLEHLLTERVDEIIDEATKEAQIPQGRTAKSVFAHQLCQTIHQFME